MFVRNEVVEGEVRSQARYSRPVSRGFFLSVCLFLCFDVFWKLENSFKLGIAVGMWNPV